MGTMNLDMSSSRSYSRNEVVTQVEFTRVRQRGSDNDNRSEQSSESATLLSVRAASESLLSQTLEVESTSKSTGKTEEGEAFEQLTARYQKMLTLIEKMFNVEINLYGEKEPPSSQAEVVEGRPISAEDVEVTRRDLEVVRQKYHQVSEQESTSFKAKGEIVLSNGASLNVDFSLDMSRTRDEQYYGEVVFTGALVDPLVVNLNGNTAQLTHHKVAFDLDDDGEDDQLHFATGDSAFLALDKNGNGLIDGGSELFGPQSGSGFADLASYDENGDGMIDELDSVFDQLVLTQRDENGQETLISLKDVGIEAFILERTETPFSLFNDKGEPTGVIRETGLYVKNNGSIDSMQHVDLIV
ncbi:hypothetical protein GV054_19295 [Marinomonas mediterranea]|uniref:hypothetical protein n=1 Tax=Marinomonas mediterranea TaxID=119864 RepID=UPI0023497F08|nr:hypothetical protein [Marinomonas mediterranea]WCN15000.1 hypothetical protein GV054_19295 [Marinomonas mediterranea]